MKYVLTTLLMAACAVSAAADTKAESPNIIFILTDDLGWSDISAHPGGSIRTPTIERLFEQGVELRNFMGWCVCSPTRAMLLTGRHPFRVSTGPEVGGELAKAETTIADAFKAHGYRTGVFGKWHNGEYPDTPEYRRAFEEAWKSMPNKKLRGGLGVNEHGFDEAWVYYGGGATHSHVRLQSDLFTSNPAALWLARRHSHLQSCFVAVGDSTTLWIRNWSEGCLAESCQAVVFQPLSWHELPVAGIGRFGYVDQLRLPVHRHKYQHDLSAVLGRVQLELAILPFAGFPLKDG